MVEPVESTDKAVLVVEGGPQDGQTIPVRGPSTTMGRHARNDVVVAEEEVSRSHAEIVEGAPGYQVRDLGSTNGTLVNDESIGEGDHLLEDGDRIRLGAATVSFVFYCQSSMTEERTVAVTVVRQVGEHQQKLTGSTSLENERRPGGGPSQEARLLVEDQDLHEGSVRLILHVAEGGMGLVLNFAREIRDNPETRVLRMVNEPGGAVHIWIALRQPVSLRQILSGVPGVVNVSPTRGRDLSIESDDAPLTVMLSKEDLASSASSGLSACVSCEELLEPGTKICPHCREVQA